MCVTRSVFLDERLKVIDYGKGDKVHIISSVLYISYPFEKLKKIKKSIFSLKFLLTIIYEKKSARICGPGQKNLDMHKLCIKKFCFFHAQSMQKIWFCFCKKNQFTKTMEKANDFRVLFCMQQRQRQRQGKLNWPSYI